MSLPYNNKYMNFPLGTEDSEEDVMRRHLLDASKPALAGEQAQNALSTKLPQLQAGHCPNIGHC